VEKVALPDLKAAIRVFVDRHRTVYVADFGYHQIVKIAEGEAKGSMVAGGSEGSGDGQLRGPTGVLVDKSGSVYVTDCYNHRVMCWPPGAISGTLIAGGHGNGFQPDQLNRPQDLAFDLDENLYVLDTDNYRVQKFVINKSLI
jgi:DNA-binding beta-propeller fold protein YncE